VRGGFAWGQTFKPKEKVSLWARVRTKGERAVERLSALLVFKLLVAIIQSYLCLFRCPRYDRSELIRTYPSERVWDVLGNTKSAQAIARWFIRVGVLEQFRIAREIDKEDTGNYQPLFSLNAW